MLCYFLLSLHADALSVMAQVIDVLDDTYPLANKIGGVAGLFSSPSFFPFSSALRRRIGFC